MSPTFLEFAETVERLDTAVEELDRHCPLLQVEPLQQREWFELLRQKLLPQLRDDAFLVVAVVGGTNIGKSVIFNHIAGTRASSTSPLASGTKHPVCLVPPGFNARHDLSRVFQGFELHEWTNSDAALEDRPEHRLFWQTSEQPPGNLLVLDTPDIDSDAQVNWQRADHIRRCSDVLIAVLTQQKYNDAAVKQFFRKSAAEDQAVIVVFNQCQLPEDDQYWPLWLDTFCRETDIQPEFVYIAPSDRCAAEENRLPFFERIWPLEATDVSLADGDGPLHNATGRDLARDLSRLHFAKIKLRTLRGSLRRLLHPDAGVPGYLCEIERRSAEFCAAAERFSAESVVKIRDWPMIPNALLVAEIRQWWRSQQEGWAQRIQGFYETLGRGVLWPVRFARDKVQGENEHPFELYRKQEWSAVLKTVEELFEKLTWMSESGNELLRPNLERLLAGKSRAQLLEGLKDEHQQLALQAVLEDVVAAEMLSFRQGSPELFKFYRQLNNIAAAARPMTSVVLFTLGWGPAGHLVTSLVADAATQAVVPIVADLAGGAAAAVAGEQAVAGAAGKGAGFLQAKFQRLQTAFTEHRASWLLRLLKERLLGTLPEDLQAATCVPESQVFQEVSNTLKTLEEQLKVECPKSVTS